MKRLVILTALALALIAASTSPAQAKTTGRCFAQSYINGEWWVGYVGVTVNTSCPFAQRVTRAAISFVIRNGGVGPGAFYITAFSPVTYRWYRMRCYSTGDLYANGRATVDCRGGINARVVFTAYHG
jgi:hypothetical protein